MPLPKLSLRQISSGIQYLGSALNISLETDELANALDAAVEHGPPDETVAYWHNHILEQDTQASRSV